MASGKSYTARLCMECIEGIPDGRPGEMSSPGSQHQPCMMSESQLREPIVWRRMRGFPRPSSHEKYVSRYWRFSVWFWGPEGRPGPGFSNSECSNGKEQNKWVS